MKAEGLRQPSAQSSALVTCTPEGSTSVTRFQLAVYGPRLPILVSCNPNGFKVLRSDRNSNSDRIFAGELKRAFTTTAHRAIQRTQPLGAIVSGLARNSYSYVSSFQVGEGAGRTDFKRRIMTIQLGICVPFVSVLILLPPFSTRARSLAAIDESVTRSKITWNSPDQKPRQTEARNLEELESRTPIEYERRGTFGRIQHYVSTHKELLASDVLLFSALSADAISSVHCVHMANLCYEGNRILPDRPSDFVIWGYFTGLETIYITASHLWWHKHPDSRWRHIAWVAPIAYSIYEVPIVRSNWDYAPEKIQRLREARARVSR